MFTSLAREFHGIYQYVLSCCLLLWSLSTVRTAPPPPSRQAYLQGLEESEPNDGSELLEIHIDSNVRGGDVLVLGLLIWVLEHDELGGKK